MADDDLFSGVLPFLHTADERSFRRAAERLGVTPAAISKAVARLEERLGVPLLVRTSRSVALTPEGAEFRERCREAVASLTIARDRLARAREAPGGELVVSLTPVVGSLVVGALPRLFARWPALAVRLSQTDRLTRLAQESVDVAVRVGAREDSTLVSRRLLGPRWWVVGAPAYLARRGRPEAPEELAAHACVAYRGPDGRDRPWVLADVPELAVRGPLTLDTGPALVEAALAGLGLAQVLDFMAAEAVRDGRLERVLVGQESDGPPIHAVSTPERARSPNVRAFVSFLVEEFSA